MTKLLYILRSLALSPLYPLKPYWTRDQEWFLIPSPSSFLVAVLDLNIWELFKHERLPHVNTWPVAKGYPCQNATFSVEFKCPHDDSDVYSSSLGNHLLFPSLFPVCFFPFLYAEAARYCASTYVQWKMFNIYTHIHTHIHSNCISNNYNKYLNFLILSNNLKSA